MVTVASRMPLIEGVGDEVLLVVGVIVLVICIVLAWFSTSVTDNHLIRTAVLVIERRPSPAAINAETSVVASGTASTTIIETDTSSSKNTVLRSTSSANTNATTGTEGTSVESTLRHRTKASSTVSDSVRLETVGDADPTSAPETGVSNRSKSTPKNPIKGLTEVEPDIRRSSSSPQLEATGLEIGTSSAPNLSISTGRIEVLEAEDISDDVASPEPGLIKIRLKFLNDSQRLVSGKLEEPLGDFKRRCFHEELDNDKVVRLIFNGQLLRSDQETLQFYGLYDNCVVHCQISNNVTNSAPAPNETFGELDLSRFMLPLFGVILGVIWYCRIQYRQFFNATSTFALLGITGLFFISLAAICIPRRERPPWAT